MGRLGIAVVGIGNHARKNILPAVSQCSRLNLVGLYSRNRDIVREESERYGCVAYASEEDLAEDRRVQVAFLCLPVGLHAKSALRLLNHGKHVWCEKSLASNPEDWEKMVATAEKSDLSLCETFMFLYHPQFQRMMSVLRSGRLGALCTISASFGYPHFSRENIRYSPELGGGALLDAGCYPVRAVMEIAGTLPTASYSSLIVGGPYSVDTGGAAMMTFPAGVHAFLDWGMGRSYRNQIEIWGEKGEMLVERAFSKPHDLETKIALKMDGKLSSLEAIPPCNHFITMMENLSESVINRRKRRDHWKAIRRQGQILFHIASKAPLLSYESHPFSVA
jgi:predicted dehydrogenase